MAEEITIENQEEIGNTTELAHNDDYNAQGSENLILEYNANNILYSISFQNYDICRLALGTLEMSLGSKNRIEIVETHKDKFDYIKQMHVKEIEFPTSKLMWSPSSNNSNLLAGSSDIIRLYSYNQETEKLDETAQLNNKKSKYCDPITSFDWNRENNAIIGTASIDSTCTIWDLVKSTIRTQLIAHDREVFDIAFSKEENTFISTGADGSIRLFDLRSLDHSTIIFETKDHVPMTRIAWNMHDNYYISAILEDKSFVYIIDTRNTGQAIELISHTAAVNNMAWAPQSNAHICTVGEDKNVFIWDTQRVISTTNENGPILSYNSPGEINNISWSEKQMNWIGIVYNTNLQLLKI